MSSRNYRPMPRCYHIAASAANRVIVYNGESQDYSMQNRQRLASIVEEFHPHSEQWDAKISAGEAPAPGVRRAASASSKDFLFTYGGRDSNDKFLSSLHQLNVKTYEWNELPRNAQGDAPMPKWGAAMVACGDVLYSAVGRLRHTTRSHPAWVIIYQECRQV